MKRMFSLALLLLLALSLAVPVLAAEAPGATVFVTISDASGKLALTQERISVTDADGDGTLTISDALSCAHAQKYPGGAAAGYGAEASQYGVSMTKLWGSANGGSYGYYRNSAAASGLTAPVQDGDYVDAFVYTDLTAWSDTYCYFDVRTAEAKRDDTLTLTLSAAGFDADWNPAVYPVADAVILLDGVETTYKTDAAGKVTLPLGKSGTHVVSAKSATGTLVPPACVVTVKAPFPVVPVVIGGIALLAVAAGVVLYLRKRRGDSHAA